MGKISQLYVTYGGERNVNSEKNVTIFFSHPIQLFSTTISNQRKKFFNRLYSGVYVALIKMKH